eukprot:380651-Amphidinium_carterae.1
MDKKFLTLSYGDEVITDHAQASLPEQCAPRVCCCRSPYHGGPTNNEEKLFERIIATKGKNDQKKPNLAAPSWKLTWGETCLSHALNEV